MIHKKLSLEKKIELRSYRKFSENPRLASVKNLNFSSSKII